MILFTATSRRAVCLTDDPLTVGSVGLEVRFQLAGWDAAPARVAVFTAGQVKVDVALSGSSCALPPEVLATAGETLVIGLYGTGSDGEIVIPTIYAEAGRILPGAAPSGIEPTPQTQPLIDQLLEAAEDARDLAQSVRDDADNGAFDGTPGADGKNGNIIWWTSERPIASGDNAAVQRRKLHGPDGLTPAVGDYVFGPAVAEEGEPTTLYVIITVSIAVTMTALGRIVGPRGFEGDPGSDGYSPEVTIETITGGHRVTITDADHPLGQSFDVMDGSGGSVTVDDEISGSSENPVQNKVIKAALDEKANISSVPTKTSDLQNDSGFLTQHQSLAAYRTAAAQDVIDAGKADKVTEVTLATDGTVTQALDAGKAYHFTGALTALTITLNAAASGQRAQYHFDFESGATAPTVTIPNTVTMPTGFQVEANKRYEIDILDGYGVAQSWEVSSS